MSYCCSVAKSCPPLCNPLDCSTPGFPVLHYLPNSCPLSRWSYPTISSSATAFSFCHQSFPTSGFSSESALCIRWPKYWSFSASARPFSEYSGLISFRIDWFDLQHHILKQKFFRAQLSLCSTLTSIHDYWKNHSFDHMNLCQQSVVSAFLYSV